MNIKRQDTERRNHVLGAEVKMQKVCNFKKFMSLKENRCYNYALSQFNDLKAC